MTTHVEHRTTVVQPRFTLLRRFAALLGTRFKAWRAQQIERSEIEALEALGPDVLNDIGVTIVKTGKPPRPIAVCNPHVIAAAVLSTSQSTERGEF